ncbi:hypothetical protein ABZ686_31490, partial [Streptomyces sp. NPDC006992]
MTTPARPPASAARLRILVPEELRHFLPARRRGSARDPDGMPCPYDGAASLGHVVQSLGVPLTEVSRLRADGEPVPAAYPDADDGHGVVTRVEYGGG